MQVLNLLVLVPDDVGQGVVRCFQSTAVPLKFREGCHRDIKVRGVKGGRGLHFRGKLFAVMGSARRGLLGRVGRQRRWRNDEVFGDCPMAPQKVKRVRG